MNERTYSDKESLTQMSGFFDRELLEIADILDLSIGALMMGESAEQSLTFDSNNISSTRFDASCSG